MGELDSARDPGAARPATVDAEQRKAFQHQAELQALRNEAREEARREGHREGFEAGREEGHEKTTRPRAVPAKDPESLQKVR